MAKRIALFGPTLADTTAETVFTNLANTVAKLESFTMASPAGALATTIRLSLGTDGVTTRVMEYSLPAGPQFVVVYPGWHITGTTIVQLSSTVSDDAVVCYGSGTVDVA
jgi:hypothetical protein